MTPPVLVIENAVKRYRRRLALDNLSLSVPHGSIFGLVGSNGAGKTTAMGAAAGLLRLHGGGIRLFGREGGFDPRRHAGAITLLPQDARLPGHATVSELMHYYARLQGMARQEADQQSRKVLDEVHLADRVSERIRTLSHGMRRRVALAQAFLGSPKLVLLDEPLNGLDPVEVANIRALILRRKGQGTTVISSHILKEIEAVCDHVAFIEHGRLVRQDELHRITGSRRVMTYELATSLPVDVRLSEQLPELRLTLSRERTLLTAETEDGSLTPADLNARLLPVLLQAGAAVVRVQPGNSLEDAYLAGRRS